MAKTPDKKPVTFTQALPGLLMLLGAAFILGIAFLWVVGRIGLLFN